MTLGAFDDRARAAIYEVGGGRCIGCGDPNVTAQHRRARGMGGTSDVTRGHPANGVPLCGSGTTGCHGWTEAHPDEARLLGWRLDPGQDALGSPFWTRYGWKAWGEDREAVYGITTRAVAETMRFPFVVYVDEDDLDDRPRRLNAVTLYTIRTP